eukprot:1156863-Pelagomonas_calceolata.AAC.9
MRLRSCEVSPQPNSRAFLDPSVCLLKHFADKRLASIAAPELCMRSQFKAACWPLRAALRLCYLSHAWAVESSREEGYNENTS